MRRKAGYAGIAVVLFLTGLWLPACRSADLPDVPATTEPFCAEAGVVRQETVEETAQGYDYDYVIYLPPCYGSDTEKAYPVLYLLPGRGGGAGSWFAAGVNEVADDMILSGKVPPFLIVGTQEIGTDELAETIYNDLVPHIENRHRVKAERPFRAVAGGSLGSIGAYRLAFQHPEQFASAGMFGGGLVHGEEARVDEWLNAMNLEDQPRVFLNTGEQDPLMLERAKVMIDVLDERKMEHSEIFTPGEHTYGYWVSNFPAYLEWLAKDWKPETG